MSKSDIQLKQDIEQELRFDPKINAAQIGVTVEGGAVSLLGSVDTYAEKWAAEDATKRVHGVRAVAQDLTVKILGDHKRSDSEIAGAIVNAITWDVFIPSTVTAKVQDGIVTLSGSVSWNFQRDAAGNAVRYLMGVTGVNNGISLAPQTSAVEIKEKIQAALLRQASADAKSIKVDTSGGKVTLSGHTSSWQSIDDASNAAWAAPGVTEVIDHVKISAVH